MLEVARCTGGCWRFLKVAGYAGAYWMCWKCLKRSMSEYILCAQYAEDARRAGYAELGKIYGITRRDWLFIYLVAFAEYDVKCWFRNRLIDMLEVAGYARACLICCSYLVTLEVLGMLKVSICCKSWLWQRDSKYRMYWICWMREKIRCHYSVPKGVSFSAKNCPFELLMKR